MVLFKYFCFLLIGCHNKFGCITGGYKQITDYKPFTCTVVFASISPSRLTAMQVYFSVSATCVNSNTFFTAIKET